MTSYANFLAVPFLLIFALKQIKIAAGGGEVPCYPGCLPTHMERGLPTPISI